MFWHHALHDKSFQFKFHVIGMKEEGKLSMPSAICLGHQSSHSLPYPIFMDVGEDWAVLRLGHNRILYRHIHTLMWRWRGSFVNVGHSLPLSLAPWGAARFTSQSPAALSSNLPSCILAWSLLHHLYSGTPPLSSFPQATIRPSNGRSAMPSLPHAGRLFCHG